MKYANLDRIGLHYQDIGSPEAPAIVFCNSLGTDMRIWAAALRFLPKGYRKIIFDQRGHGLSEVTKAPYSMGMLVSDAEALLDFLEIRDCVFVGLSIGGMVAQGLAVKRPDLVQALVLSNTATKIGTRDMWQERIEAVQKGGIEAIADATMTRWFSTAFRARDDLLMPWRNMLVRQPLDGYIGAMYAISGTDFYASTSNLTLPTLGIAGTEDGSTPPDLVHETLALIAGSETQIIGGVGHIPCVEKPKEFAQCLTHFLDSIGCMPQT